MKSTHHAWLQKSVIGPRVEQRGSRDTPSSTEKQRVVGGDLDGFFATARADASLPVVTAEIGDVWIQARDCYA